MKWHHVPGVHAVVCPVRSRWRRWLYYQPFWREDNIAIVLDIAHTGCYRCGRDYTVKGEQ